MSFRVIEWLTLGPLKCSGESIYQEYRRIARGEFNLQVTGGTASHEGFDINR